MDPEGEDLDLSTHVLYSKLLNAQLTMALDELAEAHQKIEKLEETAQDLRIKVTRLEYGLPDEDKDEEEPMEAPG